MLVVPCVCASASVRACECASMSVSVGVCLTEQAQHVSIPLSSLPSSENSFPTSSRAV
jgi:hypothetical protein